MSDDFLKIIRTRRVARSLTDRALEREKLEKVLEAARWSPTGGNARMLRFVAVTEPELLRLIRLVSPGMWQRPQAVVVVCTDQEQIAANQLTATDHTMWVDIGAVMQTMMLAAHALELGSGPVTSFSHEAVRVVLNLPARLEPELMVTLGYKPETGRGARPSTGGPRVTWQSLTSWERFPGPMAGG